MKNLRILLCTAVLLFTCLITAQSSYTVNGETITLKTEVEGKISLLWNTINGEYRYFIEKNNEITELINTKENGAYTNAFKQVLASQTSDVNMETAKVKLTLPSLRKFFNAYNQAKDPSFVKAASPLKPVVRLGGFAGITNSNFTENPDNSTQLQLGAEIELADRSNLKRHAIVLRFVNTFESSDYNYSAFQTSLNYRFKFLMQSKFDIYANTKFAAYNTFKSETILSEVGAPETIVVENSGDNFDFPFSFGLGADYAIGNGYITLLLDDLVGLNIKGNGEFPTNIQLGYKFEL